MPERVKDAHSNHEKYQKGLTEGTTAFNKELAAIFPNVRYTSGKRNASQKIGKHAGHSHHEVGDAVDIGAEHADIYEYLTTNPDGMEMMTRHGMGILDETDPETMAKTGATRPHYHIGKDKALVEKSQHRMSEYVKNGNVVPRYQKVGDQEFDYTETPIVTQPDAPVIKNEDLALSREVEKQVYEDARISASEDRQEIERVKAIKRAILEESVPTYVTNDVATTQQEVPQAVPLNYQNNSDIQQPDNTPIFQI